MFQAKAARVAEVAVLAVVEEVARLLLLKDHCRLLIDQELKLQQVPPLMEVPVPLLVADSELQQRYIHLIPITPEETRAFRA